MSDLADENIRCGKDNKDLTYQAQERVLDHQTRKLVLVPGYDVNGHSAPDRLAIRDQFCL